MKKPTLRQRIIRYFLREAISDPTHWLTRAITAYYPSSSGQNVTSDTSLKVSAVYACVKVIAEAIASLPLMLYERDGESKQPVRDYPLYSLLHNAPNSFMTSFEWREVLMAHQLLRGNTYNFKEETATTLKQLIPLNPARMEPERIDGKIRYNYTHEDGKTEKFPAEKIWHIKNMPISASYSGSMPEGLIGLSPISIAREPVGIAMAADQYGGRYFSNNASIGIGISFPDKISDNLRTYLNDKLTEFGKSENKFKSLIMDQGGTLNQIGLSNEDSQFLESRQFQIEEIARIYRVPPVLIGHPTNTMTYASAEQLFLNFATYTIRPWCVRLEQSMNRYLLSERERSKYFFEFNMDGLLRGDFKTRMEGYGVLRQWGIASVDELRAKENWNPLPNGKGKIYLQPLNMVEAGEKPPEEGKGNETK